MMKMDFLEKYSVQFEDQSTTKIEKGECLTVRYTPFLQGTLSRKKWLKEQRFVDCKCDRCKEKSSTERVWHKHIKNLHEADKCGTCKKMLPTKNKSDDNIPVVDEADTDILGNDAWIRGDRLRTL